MMEESSPHSSVEAPDPLSNTSLGQSSAADGPRRLGKRNGPFKRSKTGCSTCKSRGKKCDEAWDQDGKCERCLNGGLECHGRSEPVKRTRTAGPRPSISASTAASHPSPAPMHQGAGTSFQPTPSGSKLMSSTSSPSMSNLRSTQAPPPVAPTHILPPPALPTPSYDTSTAVNPAYLMPTPSSGTHSTPHQPQSQFDWLKDSSNEPFAFLNTSFDASYAVDSTQQAGWNHNSFWDDFGSFLLPQSNTSPFNPTPNAGLESRLLFVPGGSSNPMRRGVSLAEIYARVVESWLVGLPSNARDYARARIMALNDTNSAMRAVRYAVAVAYIFLFTGGPQGTQNNALVELAYRGAGMEERTPGQQSTTEEQNQGDAVKKLRSYVDQVSTPFAADSESSKWTQDAIKEIREVVVTDQNQLSDLLWGVIDLQLVEFIRGGAEPSYNMLALGDRLVRSVKASLQPSLTLSQLRTSETFSLRLYAFSDVSRCIVQRGRKTICRFIADQSDESVTTPAPGEEPWATYLGLPDSIIMLLADIVNLCADQPTENPYNVKSRADQIESALKEWKPTSLPSTTIIDSTALVSRTIAGQLWRLCAMVLLYQSVHRVGGLHPILRHARSEILNLLDSVVRLPNGDLWGFIALPSFLAAGLSVSDSDRKRAMKHMARTGPERVWLDNIALIEKLWEETDQTGKLTDWHDKMTREGMSVAFF